MPWLQISFSAVGSQQCSPNSIAGFNGPLGDGGNGEKMDRWEEKEKEKEAKKRKGESYPQINVWL